MGGIKKLISSLLALILAAMLLCSAYAGDSETEITVLANGQSAAKAAAGSEITVSAFIKAPEGGETELQYLEYQIEFDTEYFELVEGSISYPDIGLRISALTDKAGTVDRVYITRTCGNAAISSDEAFVTFRLKALKPGTTALSATKGRASVNGVDVTSSLPQIEITEPAEGELLSLNAGGSSNSVIATNLSPGKVSANILIAAYESSGKFISCRKIGEISLDSYEWAELEMPSLPSAAEYKIMAVDDNYLPLAEAAGYEIK